MRNAFADEITKLAQADKRIVLLSGDIGNRLFDRFKEACPHRFYNCGVAEANMIGMAAGLAMCGLRPVCYTIAPFLTYRCMEQIRVDLCYHHVPVTLVGTGAGLAYASLGATHHSCEEVGMLRLLPGLNVMAPGDAWEVRACLGAALAQDNPTYIRIGKKGEPLVHESKPEMRVGQALQLSAGSDVALLSSGAMLPEVIALSKLLENQGIRPAVYSLPTTLTASRIQQSFASPDTLSFWTLPSFIATARQAGFSATKYELYFDTLLVLPAMFAAMVFMAASFSLRLARLGGLGRVIVLSALAGFGVYFFGDVTQALGETGILPVALAAAAPATAAILLGMTLVFHQEDG